MENIYRKIQAIIAHDYLLLKEFNVEGEEPVCTNTIQISIQEAKLFLEEILKEDFLQKEHTDKYPTYKTTDFIIKSKGWTKSKIL